MQAVTSMHVCGCGLQCGNPLKGPLMSGSLTLVHRGPIKGLSWRPDKQPAFVPPGHRVFDAVVEAPFWPLEHFDFIL